MFRFSQNLVVSRSSQTLGVKDQNGAGTSAVVVLGYGPQAVVERPATQGQALAHHAEAAAVVEGDGGVEAAPAVELHAGPEPVDARRDIEAASR